MTEGGIAEWKKKEGESFAAGDVLLEIVPDLTFYLIHTYLPSRKLTKRLLMLKLRMMAF